MKIRLGGSKSAKDFSGAMTDISFLLIIFFLVTAVFVTTRGIFLRLPETDSAPKRLHPEEVIIVEILSGDRYRINRDKEVPENELAAAISDGMQSVSNPVLVINAAGDVIYQDVLDVLETAKTAGVTAFSIQYSESEPRGLKLEEGGA